MPPCLYLIISTFFMSSSSVIGAFYNQKNEGSEDATVLYNCILLLTVFCGWCVLFVVQPSFDWKVLPYSLLFGAFFIICQVGNINALKTGPTALTSLMLQLSLIAVTVWGFFFWDTAFTGLVAVGILLVAVSLWLCLSAGKGKGEEKKKTSAVWLIFTLMAFGGNAGCSIVQKTQQMKFDGAHGNMLMLFATGISAAYGLIVYLKNHGNRGAGLATAKATTVFPIVAGICNVLLNLFVMILATTELSPSLIYPVLSVGGILITSVFSAAVFKEKLSWPQWLGVAIGTIAIALLSL